MLTSNFRSVCKWHQHLLLTGVKIPNAAIIKRFKFDKRETVRILVLITLCSNSNNHFLELVAKNKYRQSIISL